MHNETVFCKSCGKKLAWWDMFTNIQYEDEYECDGKFRRLTHSHLWKSKDGKSTLCSKNRDKEDKKKYPIEVKSEVLPCALYYHTKFCITCAKKSRYKCVRPRCKGHLQLVRRQDEKPTKCGHGGY